MTEEASTIGVEIAAQSRLVHDHKLGGPLASNAITIASLGARHTDEGWPAYELRVKAPDGTARVSVNLPFQHGSTAKEGYNGLTNEALLAVVIDRLRAFQSGRFRCAENRMAMLRIQEGMNWLHARTMSRKKGRARNPNATASPTPSAAQSNPAQYLP